MISKTIVLQAIQQDEDLDKNQGIEITRDFCLDYIA